MTATQKIPGLRGKHIAQMMTQLADLLAAGCSINRSLEAISRQAKQPPLAKLAESLRRDISNGVSLAGAMEKIPGAFGEVQISMIRAAETGGFIQQTLCSLAEHALRQQETFKQVKARMAYPIMLGVTVVISIVFLLGFVVPKFTAVYKSTNQLLPAATQALLNVSEFLKFGWVFILVGVAALVLLVWWVMRFERAARWWDTLMLSIPVLGPAVRGWTTYRFAGTMSLLLRGGVTALQSLRLTAGVVGNSCVRKEIEKLADAVEHGRPISEGMSGSRIFDSTTLEMVFVSESTGKLGEVFERLSQQKYRDFQMRMGLLLSMLEPIIIVIMSIIVGLTVVALLMPVFSMDALIE